MRQVVERHISTKDAVKAYHNQLEVLGITPSRPLTDDIAISNPILSAEAQ